MDSPILDVPPRPETALYINTAIVPEWLTSLAVLLSNGIGGEANGLTFDDHGNLVCYRRLSVMDKKAFPYLETVNEVWITIALPEP